jgi:hypothetical protein
MTDTQAFETFIAIAYCEDNIRSDFTVIRRMRENILSH